MVLYGSVRFCTVLYGSVRFCMVLVTVRCFHPPNDVRQTYSTFFKVMLANRDLG